MLNRTNPEELGASDLEALVRRVDYISDASHKNHIGKQVHPARNYGCNDQSKDAFLEQVKGHYDAYRHYRKSNRLKGPTTDRLFDEIIYSSEKGAYLTTAERDAIERRLIKKFCKSAAVRTAWHIGEDGRADLHLLMSAQQPSIENPEVYEVIFGQAIGNRIAACISCDREIVKMLNANPDRNIEHTAAYDVGKAKKRNMGEKIARKWPNATITADNIGKFITKLGHTFVEVTKKSVSLIHKGAYRITTRPLRDLLLSIGEAQLRYKRERDKKAKAKAAEKSQSQTHIPKTTSDPSPAEQVLPEPLEQAPANPQTPNRKFLLLKAYLDVATGRTKVDATTKVKLKQSTKRMLTEDGNIKDSILNQLSDSEKAILLPLAEKYSQQLDNS